MKKNKILAFVFLLMFTFSLTVPAYAAVKESHQISSYSIDALPASNSRIAVEFSVVANYQMTKIGAESIVIYENEGTYWQYVKTFTQSDSGMTRNNAFNYGNTVYYSGTPGKEYRVSVTIFAEDSSGGSDSRSESFYVTAV